MPKSIWYIIDSKKFGIRQKNEKRVFFVKPEDIWSIRADRDYQTVETISGETYEVRGTMKEIIELMQKYNLPLFELNRGVIMNINHLEEVDWRRKRTAIMKHPRKETRTVETIGIQKWPEIEKRFGFAKVGT